MPDRRGTWFWLALPFAAVLFYTIVLTSRGVFFNQWFVDFFIPLEEVKQLADGHVPHRDFPTPVGLLWCIINYLPTLVAPLSARTIIFANALVALGVVAATVALGRQRLPLWVVSPTALYLALVVLSPRQLGLYFAHHQQRIV